MILLFFVTGFILDHFDGDKTLFSVLGVNAAGIFQNSAAGIDCQLHTVTQVTCEAFQLTVTIQVRVQWIC